MSLFSVVGPLDLQLTKFSFQRHFIALAFSASRRPRRLTLPIYYHRFNPSRAEVFTSHTGQGGTWRPIVDFRRDTLRKTKNFQKIFVSHLFCKPHNMTCLKMMSDIWNA